MPCKIDRCTPMFLPAGLSKTEQNMVTFAVHYNYLIVLCHLTILISLNKIIMTFKFQYFILALYSTSLPVKDTTNANEHGSGLGDL